MERSGRNAHDLAQHLAQHPANHPASPHARALGGRSRPAAPSGRRRRARGRGAGRRRRAGGGSLHRSCAGDGGSRAGCLHARAQRHLPFRRARPGAARPAGDDAAAGRAAGALRARRHDARAQRGRWPALCDPVPPAPAGRLERPLLLLRWRRHQWRAGRRDRPPHGRAARAGAGLCRALAGQRA